MERGAQLVKTATNRDKSTHTQRAHMQKQNGCSSLTAHLSASVVLYPRMICQRKKKAVSGRASNAYNRQAHCCVAVLLYMSEFGPGQVRASEEQQVCRASVKASEEQAWSKGAARVTRRVDLGCASSQTRNPALKSKMILSRARLTQTFLYVGSLACTYASTPPQTTRNSVMARPKNITTTLPHVNRKLNEPAASGCRPRAVTASAHPLHLRTGSAYPLHHSLALSRPARTHTPTHCPRTSTAPPPSRCHCQRAPAGPTHRHTASAYTLTTGHTPAEIRRRTRRGRRTMRCSKTCIAQTDRTQTIEEGCLPHSPCTCTPFLAPHFCFEASKIRYRPTQ